MDVNLTGQRVALVSGPMVNGTCGQPAAEPVHAMNILSGGAGRDLGRLLVLCARGQDCTPANKTGLGRAFLTRCYE